MLSSTILLVAAATLTVALPSRTLNARAGGPIAKPLPPNCKLTYPLNPLVLLSEGYIPAPSTDDAQFYGAHYPSFSSNKTKMAEQCLQQCYGYGDSTQCKTVFWAENVEVPKGYFGSPGGTYNTACLFFNETLGASDFVIAPEGKGTTPYAAGLDC